MAQQTAAAAMIDNRIRVIEALWRNPGLSRIDLAGLLEVDKSTLSRSTGRLIDADMVREVSQMESGPRGGRRAVGLALNGDWGCWLGLELHPDGYRGVLVDLAGRIRGSFDGRRPVDASGLEPVMEEAYGKALEEARNAAPGGLDIKGLGLGVPGPVRPDTCVVERSRPLGILSPMDIGELGKKATGLETWAEKDVNCACLAETHFADREPAANFLYILVETRESGMALGLGLVTGGSLHRGDHGAAGEFASVFLEEGIDQLTVDARKLSRISQDSRVMRKVMKELTPQIALLINVLDIDRVVLGGLFREHFEDISPGFGDDLHRRRTYPSLTTPEILPARRGDEAVAFGAAIHFTETLSTQSFWRTI